jgi:hypothetical protein
MWIYAVGGRAGALPSAPSELVFKQDYRRNVIHKKGGHYKEEVDRP